MIRRRLERVIERRCCTLLGVGPMSNNCVDVVIELANVHEVPIMLVASRRQIDSEALGGGYVNKWSTERFAEHVIDQDRKGQVFLARDHGGPWQNDVEKQEDMSLRHAMESAKSSFRVDIESGFNIIHIDPSVDIHGSPAAVDVLERVFELYEYCWSVAQDLHKDILFEIGTEEQTGSTNSQEQLEWTLNEIMKVCKTDGLPNPSFVVVQTGTKVMEMRNVGSFDFPLRIENELPAALQLPKLVDICNQYNVFIKEHNADYLSDEALSWHRKLGIHSANIAPEYGVVETKAFLQLLRSNGLDNLADEFLTLSYQSDKWRKWMLPDTEATDEERATIAGHYVFSTEECEDIKRRANRDIEAVSVDEYLKEQIRKSILRHLTLFRLVGN